jgi:hypothetical protein
VFPEPAFITGLIVTGVKTNEHFKKSEAKGFRNAFPPPVPTFHPRHGVLSWPAPDGTRHFPPRVNLLCENLFATPFSRRIVTYVSDTDTMIVRLSFNVILALPVLELLYPQSMPGDKRRNVR